MTTVGEPLTYNQWCDILEWLEWCKESEYTLDDVIEVLVHADELEECAAKLIERQPSKRVNKSIA